MPGWGNSKRKAELPADWPRLRAETRRRAGGRCEAIDENGDRCPAPGTDCDHIGDRHDHSLGNLQWLCRPHHDEKTIAERPRPKSRYRKPEPHPGILPPGGA